GGVACRTSGPVAARGRVVDVLAPGRGIARVVRAGVVVVAVHGAATLAGAVDADVLGAYDAGTGVAVIALGPVGGRPVVDAPEGRVAGIHGADVAVVAAGRAPTDAGSARAGVTRRAGPSPTPPTRLHSTLSPT